MSFTISFETGLVLLALFIGFMLYANREGIRTRSTTAGKVVYIAVVLAEVGLIVGERFVVSPVIGNLLGRDSGLYDLVDIGIFIAFALAVLAVGRRVKERIA